MVVPVARELDSSFNCIRWTITVASVTATIDIAIVVVSFVLGICIDFPYFTSMITLKLSTPTIIIVASKSMVILEVSFATIEEIFYTSIVITFKEDFGFAQHLVEN